MSKHTEIRRITAPDIAARKGKEPVVCLTAYTAPMATLLDPHCDLLLVGDSLGNVVYGFDTTLPVTLDMMIAHGAAVVRASDRACVIVDMPFGSVEEGPAQAFRNAARVMAETGASGVKLEGGVHMAETIAYLVRHSIPVMAHIGLRPQSVHVMGGFKTQGREKSQWEALEADARAVAEAGAFSVVVEGVAEPLAVKLTEEVPIVTIGIGASAACDGQVLVVDDMLGMFPSNPKFVRRFAEIGKEIETAAATYAKDVRTRQFPAPEHTYTMKK
ncbi:3-methyl-2-oxobutanoate hydroxymethyltransferase [Govanella unica]|uniref:3-methyl-2-oxobutanoate hydroxymethyltransferase n=1 Tax=Govanella unica TaxID=2975056 RepID=A0A9X3TYK0_9PROT|nr:3-methyl-2-oxobutanoate hydroxymethyltransferase [Govania unica]MDA5194330.1 3-methyl-2-oxobutanoate hydroxymethyltransferase [Govania unica]